MKLRGVVAGALALLVLTVLTGCSQSTGSESYEEPFTLPVGPTQWDATAPAWFYDGTLHVGDRTVELGKRVDEFALGATGVYWMRGETLMFTSVEDRTQKVERVGWNNMAVSADRSVFATVDQSRGPTDEFGTHVIQAAAFDTRTGKELYRTPDEEPDEDDDLADLYEETTPLLHGVSDERIFFDDATIDLRDSSSAPMSQDAEGIEVYDGWAETLFADGYAVGIKGEGRHREVAESEAYGVGRLSPDRTTLFDVGSWPTDAVAYDAKTGRQRAIDAPWDHFVLSGWTDKNTFFGVAERIDVSDVDTVLRARQVVTCEVRTLACTPVSPVIPENETSPVFLTEGSEPL